jgi:hypothetical protein
MDEPKTKENFCRELAKIDSQLGELSRRRLATLVGFYGQEMETNLGSLLVALVAFREDAPGMSHETVREYASRFEGSVQDFLKSLKDEIAAKPGDVDL